MGNLKLVTLPEPERHCPACVSEYHGVLLRKQLPEHSPDHTNFGGSGSHLPQRWRVVGRLDGAPIPIGSTLRVIAARQVTLFYSYDTDTIEWLFEVVDGPGAGEICYSYSSSGIGVDGPYMHLPWHGSAHPMWPDGLEEIR